MSAAPLGRMLAAQTAMELRLALRRGESVLVTLVIPPLLLVFLSSVPALGRSVTELLPGMVALAVMSAAMVSLGIATGYERFYGVLKRLGGSPLPRPVLILAKLVSVLGIEALQAVLLVVVAAALGWRPSGSIGLALLAVALGTAAFGGLGLWMAGSWRAEAALAGANALYVLLLLFGGLIAPPSALPGPVAQVAGRLPSAALADVLRAATIPDWGAPAGGPLLTLLAWAILAPLLAARTFRWE